MHDERLGGYSHDSKNFKIATPGLRVSVKAMNGTRRHGVLLKEDATAGMWVAKFGDSAQEEKVDCGSNRHNARADPPTFVAKLTLSSCRTELKCSQAFTGKVIGDVFKLCDDTCVQDVRDYFEKMVEDPNGLMLLLETATDPRVLQAYENAWNWKQFLALERHQERVLELFSEEEDGSQKLIWHSLLSG